MLPRHLLELLADGHRHSRAELLAAAVRDGCDPDAAVRELAAAGLELVRSADGSVGLSAPIAWLDVAAVEAAIGDDLRPRIDPIDYRLATASTNRDLLAAPCPEPGRLQVAVAEYQQGGRGRRGRSWVMPPAAGLALSVGWVFERRPAQLTALGLAVGAAARRAVRDAAGIGIGLKWPNDLIADGRKLGGILVELDAFNGDGCRAVAGIGINVRVPEACLASVGSTRLGAVDLASLAPGSAPDRSRLAGRLVAHLAELFGKYATTGFEPYRAEWLAAHVLDGQPVELATPAAVETGRVCGIDGDGALIFDDASGARRRIVSGDVTVRPVR